VQNSNSAQLRCVTVHLDMGNDFQLVSDEQLFFGANLAFRKWVFNNGVRFRTDLGPNPSEPIRGEESELILELMRSGLKGIYTPFAVVFHRNPRQRMKEKYLREWYYGLGMREVRLAPISASGHLIMGVPRYIWRQLIESTLRYASTRWTRPSGVWLSSEIKMATIWGMISEIRRQTRLK